MIFKRGRYIRIQGHFSLLQSQLAKRFTQCVSSLKLRHLTRNLRATTCILYAKYFYALRKNNAQLRSLKIDFTTKFLMAQSTITKFGLKALGTCRFTLIYYVNWRGFVLCECNSSRKWQVSYKSCQQYKLYNKCPFLSSILKFIQFKQSNVLLDQRTF